ncbi:MAG: tRNA (guanosine(37)-N1)-methyltransferase TrmD [Candidatus Magasanikbacteria bacterium]|nr:tRNA (guanosine(37)-N1)-methyltransferase TrmD [Candidatus Magasanikbacteria bacterium]
MKFNVITIFPDIISDYCKETIIGRAQKNKIININPVQLRDFAFDKHQKVDDTPYGGGAGMVMKPEPIYKALKYLKALKKNHKSKIINHKSKLTVLLSPRGRQFDQRVAEEWSKMKEITFVCGRYEGIDQRVVDHMVDEEVSVGPYVLAGGELGALIMIEAISRLLPGVLGNKDSLLEETFNTGIKNHESGISETSVEYPQYTKPEKFMKWSVPEVLLSGNHEKIREWRNKKAE